MLLTKGVSDEGYKEKILDVYGGECLQYLAL